MPEVGRRKAGKFDGTCPVSSCRVTSSILILPFGAGVVFSTFQRRFDLFKMVLVVVRDFIEFGL
jgi:hypothetical protein